MLIFRKHSCRLKIIAAFLCYVFVLLSNRACSTTIIKQDSFFVLYLSALDIHEIGSGQIKALLKPQNIQIIESVKEAVKESLSEDVLELRVLLRTFNDLLNNDTVVPENTFWLTLDTLLRPSAYLPAQVETIKLVSTISEFVPLIEASNFTLISENSYMIDFGFLMAGLTLKIKPDSISLGSRFVADSAETSNKLFLEVINLSEKPGVLAVMGIDINSLRARPAGVMQASILESARWINDIFFVARDDHMHLKINFISSTEADLAKKLLQSQRDTAVNIVEKHPDFFQNYAAQQLKRILQSAIIRSENKKLIVQAKNFDKTTLVATIASSIIISGALVAPEFIAAHNSAVKADCETNKRLTHTATELFLSVNIGEDEVSLINLVDDQYLNNLPECLAGGNYNIIFKDNDIIIECSFHDDNNNNH